MSQESTTLLSTLRDTAQKLEYLAQRVRDEEQKGLKLRLTPATMRDALLCVITSEDEEHQDFTDDWIKRLWAKKSK